mgnify:CR=1 FL=1
MKKTGFFAVAAAAFVVASTASAAALPETVKAGTYKVEPGHTQVGFAISHIGFSPYSGMFSEASGSLKFDPAHPAKSSLSITLPVSSVQTTSSVLTGELKDPNWLDAAKYPDAKFVSTKVTSTGAGTATIEGDLTLHGVTKPVTLEATFVGAGTNPLDKAYTIGFDATTTIHRSDFGVKTYLPLIGDDVKLTIAGAFEKQN